MVDETPRDFLLRLRGNIQRDIELRGQAYIDEVLGELFKPEERATVVTIP